jgi:hypothetical protein
MARVPSNPVLAGNLATTLTQMLRYGINCCAVLVVKVILIVVLTLWLPAPLAYLLIHVVTFFLSYLIHARSTFGVGYSWQGIRNYFGAVALFKAFDYLVFNVLLIAFQVAAPVSVFLASCLEAVLKFFVVRRALAGKLEATGQKGVAEPC